MNAWKTRCLGLSVVLALAVAGSARAQANGFLKLGDIGDEAAITNGMEILGIAWGGPTMNPGPMQISAAMPPPDVRTVTIMKRIDKSSPLLAQALAKGTVFPEATLRVPEGEGSNKYLEIKLTNVMISGYRPSSSQNRPVESLSLNFTSIKYSYPQKEPGGPLEAPYDLKTIPKDAPEEGRPAAPAAADLLPLNGLTLATTFIPWGQSATIAAKDASSKQGGRCFFRYRYETGNQGALAAGATTNRTHLNAANGPALANDALPGLAAGDEHTASGLLPLKEGPWTLYVHVDDDLLVAEGDEQNNLRRVRVRVEGSCGPESKTAKAPSAPALAGEPPSGTATPGVTNWLVASARDANLFSNVVVRGWDPKRKQSLRNLEMEVPPGALQQALMEAHQTGQPLDLAVKGQDGQTYLQWELKKVRVTSYSISGATDGAPGTAHVAISLGDGQQIE